MRDESLVLIFKEILEKARRSPSGVNAQPWQLVVLGDASLARLKQGIEGNWPQITFDAQQSRPPLNPEQIRSALTIPDGSLFALGVLDSRLGRGSELDFGIFLQSVRLLASGQGLVAFVDSAWQLAGSVVADAIKLPENTKIVCGVTLRRAGVEDQQAPTGAPLAEIRWLD